MSGFECKESVHTNQLDITLTTVVRRSTAPPLLPTVYFQHLPFFGTNPSSQWIDPSLPEYSTRITSWYRGSYFLHFFNVFLELSDFFSTSPKNCWKNNPIPGISEKSMANLQIELLRDLIKEYAVRSFRICILFPSKKSKISREKDRLVSNTPYYQSANAGSGEVRESVSFVNSPIQCSIFQSRWWLWLMCVVSYE